jgi:hypothetical protein
MCSKVSSIWMGLSREQHRKQGYERRSSIGAGRQQREQHREQRYERRSRICAGTQQREQHREQGYERRSSTESRI